MKTKQITLTAMGIALYVVVSMMIKIPVVNHISLDLGYLVLAFYCYLYGSFVGAVVGCFGCFIVSILATGWIGVEWPLGNLLVGFLCGLVYTRTKNHKFAIPIGIATTIIAMFIGIGIIKTTVACAIYSMPFIAKFLKNMIAFAMDAVVMSVGFLMIRQVHGRLNAKV